MNHTNTSVLLERMHNGDRQALDDILARNLDAVRRYVHGKLKSDLRPRVETGDVVNQAVAEFLEYTPAFTLTNESQLRALLCKIALNAMHDLHDYHRARRRDLAREQPLPPGTVLDLDAGDGSVSRVMHEKERRGWFRLALELLDPVDRALITLREYEGLAFAEVGERLGLSAEAARKRFERALPRLARAVRTLRDGRLTDLL